MSNLPEENNPYFDATMVNAAQEETAKVSETLEKHSIDKQGSVVESIKLNRDALEFVPENKSSKTNESQTSEKTRNNKNDNVYNIPNIPQVPPQARQARQARQGALSSDMSQMSNNFDNLAISNGNMNGNIQNGYHNDNNNNNNYVNGGDYGEYDGYGHYEEHGYFVQAADGRETFYYDDGNDDTGSHDDYYGNEDDDSYYYSNHSSYHNNNNHNHNNNQHYHGNNYYSHASTNHYSNNYHGSSRNGYHSNHSNHSNHSYHHSPNRSHGYYHGSPNRNHHSKSSQSYHSSKNNNDWGSKQTDPKMGILGIPFEYDESLGIPQPLTKDECYDLKQGQIVFLLDKQETHWTFNTFDKIDEKSNSIYIKETTGNIKEYDLNNLPKILVKPSDLKSEKAQLAKDPNRDTNLKYKTEDVIQKFVTVTVDGEQILYRIEDYDAKTSKALLTEINGLKHMLRLDQFEHEFRNISNNQVIPGTKKLDIKKPEQGDILLTTPAIDPQYQMLSRQSSNASNDSSTSITRTENGSNNNSNINMNDNSNSNTNMNLFQISGMAPLNNQQRLYYQRNEKIDLILRNVISNPHNLPLCNSKELSWNRGKLSEVIKEKMYWNHNKNSFLRCLQASTADMIDPFACLDYNNLMVVSGFGLSFYWPNFIDNKGWFNDEFNESLDSNEFKLNEWTQLTEEHSKLFMCDSQFADIAQRVTKHSGFNLIFVPCPPALQPTAHAKENINALEKLIINGLNHKVATVTHDNLGHSALIVGYCKKPEKYLKPKQNESEKKEEKENGQEPEAASLLETKYFFKIKKMISLKNERDLEDDIDVNINPIEYETIDLSKQSYVVIVKNSDPEPSPLNDKMKMNVIRDSLIEFSKQYATGSRILVNNEVDVEDLTGEPAINSIIESVEMSIENTLYMLHKSNNSTNNNLNNNGMNKAGGIDSIQTIDESNDSELELREFMENDQFLCRKLIYALIRFYDSRWSMYQFFDKLYALDPRINQVQGGLLNTVQDMKALIKNEMSELDKSGSHLFEKYVKCYDGKALPLQIPEWTINNKEQIRDILVKIKKWEKDIMGSCDDIAKLFSEHLNKIGENKH